ncbi:glycosyl transferase [Vibrio parahaemolyticus]|uniref:glycosyltransferase n=1 Tax=Vibrio parahaemolyticus TaxID=670 RepID=UPI0011208A5B|nr:glycosyltransferase [Vibrio parahaemolyticus]MBE3773233.1 glycosyltransferase [Vibrio parahaemolyticus]TOQ45383.1 glycosyl transferase [Vibrio parahaemolyticus]TOR33823.1 glycosyl transferase [Vibrio parahaemolyticus]HCE4560111.1 glycosyltransferase [Vibrio parahaemolyticus]HCG5607947.1 glycosyltransferase [Vibrio parahaemolyticus]
MKPRLVISIVSHGQGELIKDLLCDLNKVDFTNFSTVDLVLTLNIPEKEEYINVYNSKVNIIRNSQPKGFGANNNQAFRYLDSDYFVILNPDLRIESKFSFEKLIEIESKGAIAPQVKNSAGDVEDSVRKYPTFTNISRRVFFREKFSSYSCKEGGAVEVDWVAGMFILFNSLAFERLGGFDEAYFMYLEDADICRRLNNSGFRVVYTSTQSVVHDAQRKSFKSFSHLHWHVSSMLRFLLNSKLKK